MIVSSELTTGELTSMLTYCMNILMNLLMVAMVFVMLTMSLASGKRVAGVLNEKSTLANPENPVYEVKDGSIEFDNVSFSYNTKAEKPILNDINLKIKSGETIGIIGGTGSSKTSLVNLIARLYDVTEGSVKVGGKDVRDYDIETLRDKVSVVLQSNVLFSGTILDNLRWGNENATEEECVNACKLACADAFIESFPDKYNTKIEQGGTNVSGGQKQRLCIARALLKNPKILILDDSTSAVDTATDASIRKAFSENIPDTTKLIISQRVSSVSHADKIIVMDDGEISAVVLTKNLSKTVRFTMKFMLPRQAATVILMRKESCNYAGTNGRRNRGPAQKVENSGQVLKRLFGIIFKKYKFQMIIVFVCILISVLANVQGSLFIQNLIDDYITPMIQSGSRDFGPMLGAILRVAIFYAIGAASAFIYAKIMVYVTQVQCVICVVRYLNIWKAFR